MVGEGATSAPPGPRAIPGPARGTEVSVLGTAVFAVGPTVLFYGLIWLLLRDQHAGKVLMERGWVPYVTVYLAVWAGIILILKHRAFRRQDRALGLDLLPEQLGREIAPADADRFSQHLDQLDLPLRSTFLVGRLARGLRSHGAGQTREEVVAGLRSLAETDAQAVESSYTMVKVLIWAIPILGFIGTVVGIGQSVEGFQASMQGTQQMEVIRSSLGQVTAGLAVAFDTTLIALVLSLFVMFPMSALQKAEERLLSDIDDYLDLHLLSRLRSSAGAGREEPVQALLAGLVKEHQKGLADLRAAFSSVVEGLRSSVLDGWQAIEARLQVRETTSLERSERLLEGLQDASQRVFDGLAASAERMSEEARDLVERIGSAGQRVEEQVARSQAAQLETSRDVLLDAQRAVVALREEDRREHAEIVRVLAEAAGRMQQSADSLQQSAGSLGTRASDTAEKMSEQVLRVAATVEARLREREQASFERSERVLESLEAASQKVVDGLAASAGRMSGDARAIVGEIASAGQRVEDRVAHTHAAQLAQSRDALLEAQRAVVALREEDRREHEAIARALADAASRLELSAGALASRAGDSADRIAEEVLRSTASIEARLQEREQASLERSERLLHSVESAGQRILDALNASSGRMAEEAHEIVDRIGGAGQRIEQQVTRAHTVQAEAGREAMAEAQRAILALREQDRAAREQDRAARDQDRRTHEAIVRALSDAVARMEQSAASLGRRAAESADGMRERVQSMAEAVESRTAAVASGVAARIEEQYAGLIRCQEDLAASLTAFGAAVADLDARGVSRSDEILRRFETGLGKIENDLQTGLAATRQSLERNGEMLARQTTGSATGQRELLAAQHDFVEKVAEQFAAALQEHREALDKASSRDLGAVVKKCRDVASALVESGRELRRQNELLGQWLATRRAPAVEARDGDAAGRREPARVREVVLKPAPTRGGTRKRPEPEAPESPGFWRRMLGK